MGWPFCGTKKSSSCGAKLTTRFLWKVFVEFRNLSCFRFQHQPPPPPQNHHHAPTPDTYAIFWCFWGYFGFPHSKLNEKNTYTLKFKHEQLPNITIFQIELPFPNQPFFGGYLFLKFPRGGLPNRNPHSIMSSGRRSTWSSCAEVPNKSSMLKMHDLLKCDW